MFGKATLVLFVAIMAKAGVEGLPIQALVPAPVHLRAMCDDLLDIYVDGNHLSHTNSRGSIASHDLDTIPTLIALKCKDTGGVGGILASVTRQSTGEVITATGSDWKCIAATDEPSGWLNTDFVDSSWPSPTEISQDLFSFDRSSIASDAKWIWAGIWPLSKQVFCRKTLDVATTTTTISTTTSPSTTTTSTTTSPSTTTTSTTTTTPTTTTTSTTTTTPTTTTSTTTSPSTTTTSTTTSPTTTTSTSLNLPQSYSCETNSPCSPLATKGLYHYAHVVSNKFIQCDNAGHCYEKNCPPNLVWNPKITGCSWPNSK